MLNHSLTEENIEHNFLKTTYDFFQLLSIFSPFLHKTFQIVFFAVVFLINSLV